MVMMVFNAGGNLPVALAQDCGVHASANGVLVPPCVKVVCNMHVPEPDPRHALVAERPKMVVHDGDSHSTVLNTLIVMSEENDLVMVLEPVVGDGYFARSP